MLKKFKQLLSLLFQLRKLDQNIEEIKINQGRILSVMQCELSLKKLWEYEFKIFSQWGEDGIIQFLTKNLIIKNHTFIEFGVGDFSESNCRFLMMKDRWCGYVIDSSFLNIKRLCSFYFYWQNQINSKLSFITRENVKEVLNESGFDKKLGILSVDIDGMDYHVLEEALKEWLPSILIVEYNEIFGWVAPVTVPYEPYFKRILKHPSNKYYGANLPAFIHLANQHGYGFVGTNSVGSNAFFVRRELLNEKVKESDIFFYKRQSSFRESLNTKGELDFLSNNSLLRSMSNLPIFNIKSGLVVSIKDLLIDDGR